MSTPNKNPRSMWRPKLPELPVQCASCPFREGNDPEFGEVLRKLRLFAFKPPIKEPIIPLDVFLARMEVKKDCIYTGDFVCHGTAYTPEMKLRPQSEFRQCPGATKFFRENR